MKIEYSKQAKKDIKTLNEPIKSRVQVGINKLPEGDIKKLVGRDGYYRIRIGDYRVVFEVVAPEEIIIWGVAPRGQIYKRGYK